MLTLRKEEARGETNLNWLKSKHTFSFGRYYDPDYIAFESLRVINDDWVAPGGGFSPHSHDNMEIITYVLEGALEHKDSMGNSSIILPGEVQRMSAGTGVTHSEFNPSQHIPGHLLQIWFLPNKLNIAPSYEQRKFSIADKQGKFCLVASQDGRDGSVMLHQDVNMLATILDKGQEIAYRLEPNRKAWIHVAQGNVVLNDVYSLESGDGAAIEQEELLKFTKPQEAEIIIFDIGPLV